MDARRDSDVAEVVLRRQSADGRVGRDYQVIGPLAADLAGVGPVAEEDARRAVVAAAGGRQRDRRADRAVFAHRQELAVDGHLQLAALDGDLQVVRAGGIEEHRVAAIGDDRAGVQSLDCHLAGALHFDPEAGIRAGEEVVADGVGLAAEEEPRLGNIRRAVRGDDEIRLEVEVLAERLADGAGVDCRIGGRQFDPAEAVTGVLQGVGREVGATGLAGFPAVGNKGR